MDQTAHGSRAIEPRYGDTRHTSGRQPGGEEVKDGHSNAVETNRASSRPISQVVSALRSTIGIVLEGSVVTIIIPGGPAWRATKDGKRIEVGDIVRSVDGQEITKSNAAAALRGSDLPGTPVRIEIEKRPSSTQGKWSSLDRSMVTAEKGMVVEFVVIRQDVEMVMLLKNLQAAFGNAWRAVSEGGRVQQPLEDLERCVDAVVGRASEDDARLHQGLRELERKSGFLVGPELQSVDMAMLSQKAANEVTQAHQRIRILEMQLSMVGAEVESSREEERRARAAALEAQEVFRRNDADLRAEIMRLQENMVRLERALRDETARAEEERENADKLIEEARVLRSNTEAMQAELERHDILKNKSAKASSEAVALALREVLLVQDELSAAKTEIEQIKDSEKVLIERLRVIETARDVIDLGDGHRNEQLKTLRSEIVFLRKTIDAIKDERAQMREHVAKQARELVVLDGKLADKSMVENEELESTKSNLFKVKNSLRLREAEVLALEEELKRQRQFNSQQDSKIQQAQTKKNTSLATIKAPVLSPQATEGTLFTLPLFNTRFDDLKYVLIAALLMASIAVIGIWLQTTAESPIWSLAVFTSGILFWLFVFLAIFKCAVWCHTRFVQGSSPTIVTSLPEETPLLPTAKGYQQIDDTNMVNYRDHQEQESNNKYGSRAPSQVGGSENLRNPEPFHARGPPSSVYTPTGYRTPTTSGTADQSALHITQQYLSTTSRRPLSYQAFQPHEQPYQAQARESNDLRKNPEPIVSIDSTMMPRSARASQQEVRRSREDRLASLKGTVNRQDEISMA